VEATKRSGPRSCHDVPAHSKNLHSLGNLTPASVRRDDGHASHSQRAMAPLHNAKLDHRFRAGIVRHRELRGGVGMGARIRVPNLNAARQLWLLSLPKHLQFSQNFGLASEQLAGPNQTFASCSVSALLVAQPVLDRGRGKTRRVRPSGWPFLRALHRSGQFIRDGRGGVSSQSPAQDGTAPQRNSCACNQTGFLLSVRFHGTAIFNIR
jgi:hypothetical protein